MHTAATGMIIVNWTRDPGGLDSDWFCPAHNALKGGIPHPGGVHELI